MLGKEIVLRHCHMYLFESVDNELGEGRVSSGLKCQFVHLGIEPVVIHKQRIFISVIGHCT